MFPHALAKAIATAVPCLASDINYLGEILGSTADVVHTGYSSASINARGAVPDTPIALLPTIGQTARDCTEAEFFSPPIVSRDIALCDKRLTEHN
jgi:hypothetical protein